jgi:hypothetical protein
MSAQLEAKQEMDFDDWFERARDDLKLPTKLWNEGQDLFNELDDFAIYRDICLNWENEAEIGRLMRVHFREAAMNKFADGMSDE